MLGRKQKAGEEEEDDEKEEVDDKTRRQYLAIMQYFFEHELLESLCAFEKETGIAWNENALKVSSVLEASLDMFADYTKQKTENGDTATNDDESLMQLDGGACCVMASGGPPEAFNGNVIAVAWAPAREEELVALIATADRQIHVVGPDGETFTQFTDLKSPVLSIHAAPMQPDADVESSGQEVVATTMGGEVLFFHLKRPAILEPSGWSLELVCQYKENTKQVTSGRFAPLPEDGGKSAHLVTASRDHKANVYVRSDSGGACAFSLAGSVSLQSEVTCCCWVNPDIFVLAARDDHQLHYWSVRGESGQLQEHMKTTLNVINDGVVSFAVLALAVSEDRELIAACTDKSRVIVLRTFTTTQLRNLYGATVDEYDVPSVCFSLDRAFLYTTSSLSSRAVAQRRERAEEFGEAVELACGEVVVFELRTGQLSLHLPCHEKPVRCMSRHPHTEALVTGSFDKRVKYWQ